MVRFQEDRAARGKLSSLQVLFRQVHTCAFPYQSSLFEHPCPRGLVGLNAKMKASPRSNRLRTGRLLTHPLIHHAPDCAATRMKRNVIAMTLAPSIAPADADKLELLRKADRFRSWSSLDDKRYCLVCGKIITGQEIQVAGSTSGEDAWPLCCPSERCNSIPMDWVILTDEVLARAETLAAKADAAPTPICVNHTVDLPRGIGAKLRHFASHFKRAA